MAQFILHLMHYGPVLSTGTTEQFILQCFLSTLGQFIQKHHRPAYLIWALWASLFYSLLGTIGQFCPKALMASLSNSLLGTIGQFYPKALWASLSYSFSGTMDQFYPKAKALASYTDTGQVCIDGGTMG